MISNEQILVPPGETTETYAENIKYNIEKTYPTQSLFTRLVNPDIESKFKPIESIDTLLRVNERLLNPNTPVNWSGVGKEKKIKIQKELEDLSRFSNVYKHLGISELINNGKMDPSKRKPPFPLAYSPLRSFYQNNPNRRSFALSVFLKMEKKTEKLIGIIYLL